VGLRRVPASRLLAPGSKWHAIGSERGYLRRDRGTLVR